MTRPSWLRALAWPLRRARRALGMVRRGTWYGLPAPAWWPRRGALPAWPLWLGHANKHDGREVTVFAGGRRFTLQPITHGRQRGHVYDGHLRLSPALAAQRLAAQGFDPAPALALAAVSAQEGPLDAFQTYAHGRLAWGCLQFTGRGGLPAVLLRLQQQAPETFSAYFGPAGIGVEQGLMTLDEGGRRLRGWQALNRLHDEPSLWKAFLLAGSNPAAHDAQIATAYQHYYLETLALPLKLGGSVHRLGDVLAAHPLGQLLAFDRAVFHGLGGARQRFQRAADRAGLRAPAQGAQLVEVILATEANYQRRWSAIQQYLAQHAQEGADAIHGNTLSV